MLEITDLRLVVQNEAGRKSREGDLTGRIGSVFGCVSGAGVGF